MRGGGPLPRASVGAFWPSIGRPGATPGGRPKAGIRKCPGREPLGNLAGAQPMTSTSLGPKRAPLFLNGLAAAPRRQPPGQRGRCRNRTSTAICHSRPYPPALRRGAPSRGLPPLHSERLEPQAVVLSRVPSPHPGVHPIGAAVPAGIEGLAALAGRMAELVVGTEWGR